MATQYKLNNQVSDNNTPDTQNYDINVNKLYTDFVVEVDKIRSHLSVANNPIFNTFSSDALNQANVTALVSNQVQESRCSAFYRLLGLPVTDGTNFYNPGFDQPNNNVATTTATKQKIATNILSNTNLQNLFNTRETIPNNFLKVFAAQDVEAMVLTMGLHSIRTMTIPFGKLNGIIDTNLNNQTYTVPDVATLLPKVQNNGRVSNTVAGTGATVSPPIITATNSHILAPLAVDPRIDFFTYPKRNRFAVPFLKDKSQLKISDGIYLQRPYIEKVCRDRFNTSNNIVTLGTNISSIITSIRSSQFINNNQLLQKAFNPANITSETVQFANYYNSIRSVLKTLNACVNKINHVLFISPNAKYNWTPIPNIAGPEKGCTTRDLFNGQSGDTNNTYQDNQIITYQSNQLLSSISNKLTTQQAPDLGGFAFDNTEPTPDPNSSSAFGDNLQNTIDNALADRNDLSGSANDSAQIIEMIMGEFSGIGLLDILIISSAFWLTDEADLLSLLDDTAFARLYTDTTLRCPDVETRKSGGGTSFATGLANFQGIVAQIYSLADQLWRQIQFENTQ